jgi:hypothetical protein
MSGRVAALQRAPVRGAGARRAPVRAWDDRLATTLARAVQQRAAGATRAPRDAPLTGPLLQRMKIISRQDGRELVRFAADEPKPGELEFDGYSYERAGGDNRGNEDYWRRLISYQHGPDPHRNEPKQTGGDVTFNPSPYFPQQAAVDLAMYGRRPGYGRLISESDVESLADELQQGVERLTQTATTTVSAIGSSVTSTLGSLFKGGEGTTLEEERLVRTRLLRIPDDPRVIHYTLAHSRADVTRSGLSFVLSKLTGGISSMVEKGGSATSLAALGNALASLAAELESDDSSSHSQSELHPKSLIRALNELALHYGASTVVESGKAIPFYVGTVIGGLQTLARKTAGTIDEAKEACEVIRGHAVAGHEAALRVADLLGIPREVMTARGGEKAMFSRL